MAREDSVNSISPEDVKGILGQNKVITAPVGSQKIQEDFYLGYSAGEFEEMARENEIIGADWRLFYFEGLSLRKQRRLLKADQEKKIPLSGG